MGRGDWLARCEAVQAFVHSVTREVAHRIDSACSPIAAQPEPILANSAHDYLAFAHKTTCAGCGWSSRRIAIIIFAVLTYNPLCSPTSEPEVSPKYCTPVVTCFPLTPGRCLLRDTESATSPMSQYLLKFVIQAKNAKLVPSIPSYKYISHYQAYTPSSSLSSLPFHSSSPLGSVSKKSASAKISSRGRKLSMRNNTV